MGKSALDAPRLNAFNMEPEALTLVEDPTHPLYDSRVHHPVDEALMLNIMVNGVLEPVIVRKNAESIEVVDGRSRTKAVRAANERLKAEGKQTLRIPVIVRRGRDADLFGVVISANECRRNDELLVKIEKATRLMDMGKNEGEVAIAFGVSRTTVDTWLAVQDLAEPIRQAIETGEISVTAAASLARFSKEEQVEKFERLKTEGVKPSVRQLREVAKDSPTVRPRLRSRKEIEARLLELPEEGQRSDLEKGFALALLWVQGVGGGGLHVSQGGNSDDSGSQI